MLRTDYFFQRTDQHDSLPEHSISKLLNLNIYLLNIAITYYIYADNLYFNYYNILIILMRKAF